MDATTGDVVRLLVNSGVVVDVNAKYKERGVEWSALRRAIFEGKPEIVKALIEMGADVNMAHNGWLPIHLAAFHRGIESIKALIDAGADVNAKTNDIDYAKSKYMNGDDGYLDIYQLLIRY